MESGGGAQCSEVLGGLQEAQPEGAWGHGGQHEAQGPGTVPRAAAPRQALSQSCRAGRSAGGLWLGVGRPWAVREHCQAGREAPASPPTPSHESPCLRFHSHRWEPGEPGTSTLPLPPCFPGLHILLMFTTAFSSASHTVLFCHGHGPASFWVSVVPSRAVKTHCFRMSGSSKVRNHDFSMYSGRRPPRQPRAEDQGRHGVGFLGPGPCQGMGAPHPRGGACLLQEVAGAGVRVPGPPGAVLCAGG